MPKMNSLTHFLSQNVYNGFLCINGSKCNVQCILKKTPYFEDLHLTGRNGRFPGFSPV